MPEEAKVTSRGLIEFDIGPLRRFKGTLDSLPTEPQTFTRGEGESAVARASTRVTINIKDIEVLEAIEPYHFPTFSFQMTLSNRKKSRWGVLSESFNSIADLQYTAEQLDPSSPNYVKPSDRMDIGREGIGARIGFVLADGEEGRPESPMLYDGRAGEDKPTPAWQIYEIEGVGTADGQGVSPTEIAKALLEGKTLAEFNKEALANPAVRGDVALLQAISLPATAAGNFANALVKAGEFTKDASGRFHKVQ